MIKKRRHPLRITFPNGHQVRTSEDVAYAWVKLGDHQGWTRANNPNEYVDAPRLLIPKTFDRGLAAVLLDSTPQDLRDADLAGAILITPGEPPSPQVDELEQFRQARINKAPRTPNDVTLARASTSEILDLVADHGLSIAARALQLQSLPAREELLTHLGHSRVTELLANHPELPEEVVWQTMRSKGFDPTRAPSVKKDAVGLAGNPNLSQDDQDMVIRTLHKDVTAGDPTAVAPLTRAASSPSIPERTAAWLVEQRDELPREVRLALAKNQGAGWLWLRRILDSDLDPHVALASRDVGELGITRALTFAVHPDPGVRAAAGEDLPAAKWDWDNQKHQEILRSIDDPLAEGDWSLTPEALEPIMWGPYSVTRQWAARADQHPEAERELRRLVDLHNRSWGAVGKGQGDPALAARAAGARTLAKFTPELDHLGLDAGRTYTVEDARIAAVQATAARPMGELRNNSSPIVQAVLDACAAELNAQQKQA